MDFSQVISVVISFVLGISAVMPYVAKLKKGFQYAKELLDVPEAAMDIVEAAEKALEDGNISQQEVKQIVDLSKNLLKQVNEVKELF